MKKTKKLLFAVVMVAGISGCATTMDAHTAASAQAAPAEAKFSRPASYGSMGGYRYRRFTTASAAGA